MSNALLTRPMRPLSASITGALRCGAAGAATTTTTITTGTPCSAAKPSSSTSMPSASTSMPYTQRRHESTTRRQLNRLRSVPTAPSFTPAASQTSDQIVFNPPSSAPNVYHTPLKFLPASDRRRELFALTSRFSSSSPVATTGTALASNPSYSSSTIHPPHLPSPLQAIAAANTKKPSSSPSSSLPPPVRTPYTKKYHLTESDIAEIRALRQADPAQWTRERLAAKFECSQFFVGLVAPAPEHAKRKAAEIDEGMRTWGRRKREAREDRKRRRELWGRDA